MVFMNKYLSIVTVVLLSSLLPCSAQETVTKESDVIIPEVVIEQASITPRMVILAGSDAGEFGSVDGVGTAARFKFPTGVATDINGTVFVADNGNQTIRKVTYGKAVTTLAGTIGVAGVVNATGAQAQFVDPMRLALDKQGNCYVSDNASLMRSVNPTGTVSTLVGSTAMGALDGVGAIARFSNPHGMVLDNTGNLYLADTGNFAIRKVNIASATVTTVSTTFKSVTVDMPNLATDTVSKTITSRDTITLKANAAVVQWYKNDVMIGGATAPTLNIPAVAGLVGVSDAGVYQAKTGGVAVGGKVNLVYTAEGGPKGLVLDSRGTMYVTTFGHNTVTKGSIVLAGMQSTPGYADGIEQTARFNGPSDLAVDTEDNIYVADTNNNAIRKITQYGQVSTIIAPVPPSNAVNFSDAPMYVAPLNQPMALSTDSVGNLYIADTGNHRVWRFTLTPTIPVAKDATEITSTAFTANWNTVPGVALWAHPDAKFVLNVATDQYFRGMVKTQELAGDKLSYTVTGLTAAVHYYRVAAINEGGTGLFSNTVVVTALQEPVALAPTGLVASVTAGRSTMSFTLNWTAVPNASAYLVDMATDRAFTTLVTGFSAQRATTTSMNATGLAVGTYYYRVKAMFPATGSTTTTGGNSNVIALNVLAPPTANEATAIATNEFTANWSAVETATGYVLDVSTDPNFLTKLTGFDAKDVGSALSLAMTGLKERTNYFYRVRAIVTATGVTSVPSANSNIITATTRLAGTLVNALPATNIVSSTVAGRATLGFTLNWSTVPEVTGYAVDMATDSGFTALVTGFNAQRTSATSLAAASLAPGSYYYRVREVYTPTGSTTPLIGSNSNVIAVKVLAPPVATDATESVSNAVTSEFTATWQDIEAATGYILDVASDTGFTTMLSGYNAKVLGKVTSLRLDGLKGNTSYYYRVRAIITADGFGTTPSGYSNVITTLTKMSPPEATEPTNMASTASSVEFTATWKAVTAATSYLLDIALDPNFSSMLSGYSAKDVGNTTSLRITNLDEKTNYYYRVRAVGTQTSDNSNVILARTQAMSTSETLKKNLGGGSGGGAPSMYYYLALTLVFGLRRIIRRK